MWLSTFFKLISVGNADLKKQSGCPHSIACKVVELDFLNANFFHEKYGQPKKLKKVSLCCKRFDILFAIIDLSQKKRKVFCNVFDISMITLTQTVYLVEICMTKKMTK